MLPLKRFGRRVVVHSTRQIRHQLIGMMRAEARDSPGAVAASELLPEADNALSQAPVDEAIRSRD